MWNSIVSVSDHFLFIYLDMFAIFHKMMKIKLFKSKKLTFFYDIKESHHLMNLLIAHLSLLRRTIFILFFFFIMRCLSSRSLVCSLTAD